jgi:transcriptional regulator with XRE-family HTH domain
MTTSQPTDIFQERLTAARGLRGLSQTQLATKSGLDPSSLSHFESGTRKPSFENLKRLAGALDVTTDYLLGRSDTPDTSAAPGKLHRDLHKLTDDDLKLTEEFVGMLIKRGQSKES